MRAVTSIMRSTAHIITIRSFVCVAFLAALSACASSFDKAASLNLTRPIAQVDVSSSFGRRSMSRSHYGIDLRAPIGTPVSSAGSGRVIFAGTQRGFGRLVIVNHGKGITTYYAHLDRHAVGLGDKVVHVQTVGFVGMSGNATGPHLHFEIRSDGKPIDPARVMAF